MPAHAPAAVPVVPVAVDDGEVDGVADIPDVPVALDDGEVDGVADIPDVPVAVDDGEVDGVADVPDVVDCANTAPVAARDVATMSVFNFHNFIEPPKTLRRGANACPPSDPIAATWVVIAAADR